MSGFELSTAIKNVENKRSIADRRKVNGWVFDCVERSYQICMDPDWCETLCTAWTASALSRMFAALADQEFWKNKQLAVDTGVTILRIACKLHSRNHVVTMDALAHSHDPESVRNQETVVLNTLKWNVLVASPHYFLHEHAHDFGLQPDEYAQLNTMLVHCAKSTGLCTCFKTGSLVVACLVFLKIGPEYLETVRASLAIVTTLACIKDEIFQKQVCLSEVTNALGALSRNFEIRCIFDTSHRVKTRASTPQTVNQQRRFTKRVDPGDMPQHDDERQFSQESYYSPNESSKRRRRLTQKSAS
jgi:hypothetical protein